jgi:RNA-directed DNA polymerase
MQGSVMRGNREIPQTTRQRCVVRAENLRSNTAMHGCGKSDRPIVPKKYANKRPEESGQAEQTEGRGLAKRNTREQNSRRAQMRERLQSELERIRQVAATDRKAKFTALWHHVYDIERLEETYYGLKRNSARGVDGETWEHYGKELKENLKDLSDRLARGAYHAKPVKRVYIPKPDGRQRPIGIPALEDKIVQGATAQVLNVVYEVDFKGFSYGFRPVRSQHDALDALTVGIEHGKVNWVLDIDIRAFFDTIEHEWLMKFVEHRIADKRVLRHIKKWLNAGVLEDGEVWQAEKGTPQGGSISPLLANIYLHYAMDNWADKWRREEASEEVEIIRYADDAVICFKSRTEAEKFQEELKKRMGKFGLELNAEKTRLIEFGRFAATDRERRGEGKPETFDFLGFTHICGKTRSGKFTVLRKTKSKKMRAKLKEIREELKRRMHESVPKVGKWLHSVVQGHYQYYGVPRNMEAMKGFHEQVTRYWRHTLKRRSQRGRITWERMARLCDRWLPAPRIIHPYPDQRLCVNTQGRSPVR